MTLTTIYRAGEPVPADWYTITPNGAPFQQGTMTFDADSAVTDLEGKRRIRPLDRAAHYALRVDDCHNGHIIFEPPVEIILGCAGRKGDGLMRDEQKLHGATAIKWLLLGAIIAIVLLYDVKWIVA